MGDAVADATGKMLAAWDVGQLREPAITLGGVFVVGHGSVIFFVKLARGFLDELGGLLDEHNIILYHRLAPFGHLYAVAYVQFDFHTLYFFR